jgi:hypothetical protein
MAGLTRAAPTRLAHYTPKAGRKQASPKGWKEDHLLLPTLREIEEVVQGAGRQPDAVVSGVDDDTGRPIYHRTGGRKDVVGHISRQFPQRASRGIMAEG